MEDVGNLSKFVDQFNENPNNGRVIVRRLVNPAKHPNVKATQGQAFIDWLVGPEGQAAIANYKIDGQQLFYPDADSQN